MSVSKLFIVLGSMNGLLAVSLGAFGAHALEGRLDTDMLSVYRTAVEYHFYHALATMVVGVLMLHVPGSAWLEVAGWLMLAGIVLFSGSLYVLAVSGVRWLGAITPVGGTAFIAAWVLCAIGAWKGL